ncbi:hypothetical protein FWK35_00018674, partial [Aphis craccivora]
FNYYLYFGVILDRYDTDLMASLMLFPIINKKLQLLLPFIILNACLIRGKCLATSLNEFKYFKIKF